MVPKDPPYNNLVQLFSNSMSECYFCQKIESLLDIKNHIAVIHPNHPVIFKTVLIEALVSKTPGSEAIRRFISVKDVFQEVSGKTGKTVFKVNLAANEKNDKQSKMPIETPKENVPENNHESSIEEKPKNSVEVHPEG